MRTIITPDEIERKAARAYPRFLAVWIKSAADDFFPLRISARLKPIPRDLPATIAAIERLRAASKEVRGWGYTVHWKQKGSRDFGRNLFPDGITIDTRDDLLRLTRQAAHFAATREAAVRIREEFPSLAGWVVRNVRSLAGHRDDLDGLLAVARYFLDHPWPDCYARQIPLGRDTKFIENHTAVLRQWLDELLPASAIQADETKFSLRFGLRDGQPHRAVRLLDPRMQGELGLPFDELSLPLWSLEQLPVREATVIIVENQLNLLTLPPVTRGIGLRGEGKAVTRLSRLGWLGTNAIVYWGDLDVAGFQILSSLRRLFPHARSLMMDRATLEAHAESVIAVQEVNAAAPPHLTGEEQAAYRLCAAGRRLEQERIPQGDVDEMFRRLSHG